MSWSEVVEADPDVLVLACCGFTVERTLADLPVLRSYPEWETLRCVQANSVFVVDGSAYFNRPGPRLVDSLEIPGRLGGR
jgi:iron complex transport system substrate-binding protein